MPRKFDKYGLNRQFKDRPCSRRDPFPRDNLPFVDDMSRKKTLDDAIKASKPNKFKNASKRARAEIEKTQKAIRDATKKMRKVAKKTGKAIKKGAQKAAHSKFEQYAMEAAGFGLDFLAAAILFGSDGAAAPLAELIAEEGIELQGIAAAEMVGEDAFATEETSLLRRGTVRRRTTRSGREF